MTNTQDGIFISKASADINIDTGTMKCRCKRGGCFGGNSISFRSMCATGTNHCGGSSGNCGRGPKAAD